MTTPTEPTPPEPTYHASEFAHPASEFTAATAREAFVDVTQELPAPDREAFTGTGEEFADGTDPEAAEDDPPPGDPPIEPEPRLRDPGDLIAAVPAMLGFMPARSLVVTVLRAEPDLPSAATVDVVARMDLDGLGRVATVELIERVAGICLRRHATAALALIVDDRATAPTERHNGVRGRKHRDLVHALEHRLDAEAVPLAGAWAVSAIGPDLPWWSVVDPPCRGVQPDPASSLVTLRQVLEGRPMRGSRAELLAMIAVDEVLRDEVASVLDAASAAAAERLAQAVRRADPDSYTRVTLRNVLRQIADIGSGAQLDPLELADVAVALRDSTVRDAMFALAPGTHADAAEALWLQLTRALPDPDRAEAAALLGYCAYVRGDGPLAGVALDAALNSDPQHRMAILLDIGLQTGMRPQRLIGLGDSGRAAAIDLGIDLESEPK
ncbi:DUF4192 domain-containing protein [Nocardia sp. NPDC051030]|uniref:DUF4192 domain-containing protein n=1 Tax=Nocardia sp. NPDC051030 TaxID=3155162 RepID=UPI0034136E5D